MSIIGGKLKFKGGAAQKKADLDKKRFEEYLKSHEPQDDLEEDIKNEASKVEKKMKKIEFEPKDGTGRILTSGTTVHGKDSKFMSEIKQGDTIIVRHPTTYQKEERKVIVVLSDRSLSINQAFSTDLISYTEFEFKKKDEFQEEEETLEEQYNKKLEENSKKIKKPQSVMEYREKKGMWGYQTKKEVHDKELTREELLDLRSKKSRDKFCWF